MTPDILEELRQFWIENSSPSMRPDEISLRPDVYDEAISNLPTKNQFVRIGEMRQHFLLMSAIALRDSEATERMTVKRFKGDM